MPRLVLLALTLCATSTLAQVQGSLPGDTTWSGSVTMIGDVTVPAGVTLTIQPGTTVTAAATDSLGNADATSVELIIRGTLNIAGVQGGGVIITGSGSGASAWGGIRIEEGGTATISSLTMDKSKLGIENRGGSTAGATTTLTLSNSIVKSSNACLVTNGTAGTVITTVTGTTFDTCTTGGVKHGFGTATLTNTQVINTSASANGAITLIGGALTLDKSIVSFNSTRGYYSCGANAGASLTVTSSLFTQNTGTGFYRSTVNSPDFCGGVLPTFNVTNSDIWGNSNTYGPPPTANANNLSPGSSNTNTALGANNISANPLFVDTVSRNLRLTQHSPPRKLGVSGVDMGALPYTTDPTPGPDLQGTLWENLTLSANTNVVGDLTVASGVTLNLQPGITLTFATTDLVGSGDNATRNELIVEGTLTAVGVAGSPINFTGNGIGTTLWQGVRVQRSGAATIANAVLDDMAAGVEARGSSGDTTTLTLTGATVKGSNQGLLTSGTGGTVTVSATGTTFSGNTMFGVRSDYGNTTLTTSIVTSTSASASGALVLNGGQLQLDRTTVSLNSTRGYYSCGAAAGSSFSALSSIISQNTGTGFYRSSVNSPDFCGGTLPTFIVNNCDVWGNSTTYGPPPTVNANNLSPGSSNTNTALGANNISANPLFVDAVARNLRLTQRSPARNGGTGGVDQGALPYLSDVTPGPSLQGTLWEDLALSSNTAVIGDLTVAPGVTLSIQPGVTLTLGANDTVGSSDTAVKTELIVRGTLVAVGTLASPITLQGVSAGTPTGWQGVRVEQSGTANLSNVVFDGMAAGVETRGSAGNTATLTLSQSTVTDSNSCLVTSGSGGTANATISGSTLTGCGANAVNVSYGTTNINTTVITNTSATASGALVLSGGTLAVDRVTVARNSTRGYYSCGAAAGASFSAISSIFAENTGTGFYRSSVNSPDFCGGVLPTFNVTYSDVWGNSNTYGPPPTANANNLTAGSVNTNTTLGANVISANPLFVDETNRDFHLTATSPPRAAGASGVDQGAYPFSVGPVATVVVNPMSPSVAAGGVVGFSATAYDASNNTVPGVVFTWTAVSGAGTISSSGVLTAACTPGTYLASITAKAPNAVTGTAGVVITNGAASNIVIAPAAPTVGSQKTQQFTATVVDSCNNTLSGAAITWSALSTAGSISGNGLFTGGCQRGTFMNAVTASAGSLMKSTNVTIGAGSVVAVAIVPLMATVQAGTTQQFGASAADGCGNTVNGATFTWSTNVLGGSIDTNGLFLAGQNNGVFNNGVTVSTPGASGNVSSSATVTVQGGNSGSVASVTVTPNPSNLSPNGTQDFTATAKDSIGNVVTGMTVTWAVTAGGGSISPSGHFTAGTTAGTFTDTLRATVAGVNGTATVNVQPGAVNAVTVTPPSATLAPGGQTTFTASAKDAFNNVVSGASVTWAANAAAGSITQGGVFTAGLNPGTYNGAITASVGSVMGAANVTIQAGALSSLNVTPPVASIAAGGTRGFSCTGTDGLGNNVAITPTWSVMAGGGTINSSGIFTAGTAPGTFANTVKCDASGLSAFATVTVTPGPAIAVDVTPGNATLDAGTQQLFTAAARDAFNNPVAAAFTWSANSSAGTINMGGLFTAGTDPGSYPNAVTATFNSITGNANVQIVGGGGTGGGSGQGGGAAQGGGSASGGGSAAGGGAGELGGGDGSTGGGGGSTASGGGTAMAGGGSGSTGGGDGSTGGSGSTGGGGDMTKGGGCGCGESNGGALVILALFALSRRRGGRFHKGLSSVP